MTRLWIRNLTSRNDSRTGAWVIRRWAGVVGWPGSPGPPGAAGTPGAGVGPAPGRALSILFSSDIASDPLSPRAGRYGRYHRHDHRNENNDFFSFAFRASAFPAAARSPATAEASRRMSWETSASRL